MAVGLYITYDRSDRAMIIESMQMDRTGDDGNIVTVSGRSLEILLDRRVIYEYVYFRDGKLEDYIHLLLKNAVISPKNDYRKIPEFTFRSSGDADISAITIEAQHMLIGLAHDRIMSLGMFYIERGWITADEYENLRDYLFRPYSSLGGNGSAARVMAEVDKLEIRSGGNVRNGRNDV